MANNDNVNCLSRTLSSHFGLMKVENSKDCIVFVRKHKVMRPGLIIHVVWLLLNCFRFY